MHFRSDLSATQLRDVLQYDPQTGLFTWKKRISIRIMVGATAGSLRPEGYLEIGIYGRNYLAHRLAWLWMNGEWPSAQIDHIDLRRDNNSWNNLRAATHGQNVCNSGLRRNNTSGFKGVSFKKPIKKWHAQIMADRKLYLLGDYATKEEAIFAYNAAAERLHGQFAKLSLAT